MATTLNLDAINELPTAPASDVKKIGWRGLMKTVATKGRLVVTNHGEPQAVILSTKEYEAMLSAPQQEQARKEAVLADLRRRMDEHLAPLKAPDAGERLRAAMRESTVMDGTVKEGDDVEIRLADDRVFQVRRKPTAAQFLARLRKFRGRLPVDFSFDREEANDRR